VTWFWEVKHAARTENGGEQSQQKHFDCELVLGERLLFAFTTTNPSFHINYISILTDGCFSCFGSKDIRPAIRYEIDHSELKSDSDMFPIGSLLLSTFRGSSRSHRHQPALAMMRTSSVINRTLRRRSAALQHVLLSPCKPQNGMFRGATIDLEKRRIIGTVPYSTQNPAQSSVCVLQSTVPNRERDACRNMAETCIDTMQPIV
jgi:hypothetical protein